MTATDSAAELRPLIGDDSTATFENDPTFVDSNPTGSASSENLEEQRPGAGKEFQAVVAKSGKGAGPDPDEEDEFADEEEDDDDDLDDEDEDVDDDEDDDEDLDDDEEDDDEDDLDDEDDDDEDEDDEDEDDADEVKASASPAAETLRADGLLGYEDEAEDSKNRVDRVTGDVERKRDEARKLTDDPDENPKDAYARVDPAAEREEQEDTDVFIRPVKPMDLGAANVSYAAL